MKQSKKDTTLCEKDALQDLLDAEKLLMNYYATALTEGSCRPLRRHSSRSQALSSSICPARLRFFSVQST